MDLMQMLPLLMMMNGGKGKGNQSGGMDMATMMQLMSMMGGGAFGGATNTTRTQTHEPLNMDMSKLQGMLSPEMVALLSSLARK